MSRVVAQTGELSAAHVVDLDETGLDTVKKRSEVYNAGGHDTETLDDLGANDYGPGGVDIIGGMGGTVEVYYLRDDGRDDTDNWLSEKV